MSCLWLIVVSTCKYFLNRENFVKRRHRSTGVRPLLSLFQLAPDLRAHRHSGDRVLPRSTSFRFATRTAFCPLSPPYASRGPASATPGVRKTSRRSCHPLSVRCWWVAALPERRILLVPVPISPWGDQSGKDGFDRFRLRRVHVRFPLTPGGGISLPLPVPPLIREGAAEGGRGGRRHDRPAVLAAEPCPNATASTDEGRSYTIEEAAGLVASDRSDSCHARIRVASLVDGKRMFTRAVPRLPRGRGLGEIRHNPYDSVDENPFSVSLSVSSPIRK